MRFAAPRRGHALFLSLAVVIGSTAPSLVSADAHEDTRDYSVEWSNGLEIERNDGYHKLKLGGRVYVDAATISGTRGIESWVPGATGTGIELRTARLHMEGTLYERLVFKAEVDFASGAVAKDVFVGLKRLPALGQLRVGQFKEPFSLEEMTSSRYITFMERSLTAVFNPARNPGILLNNAILDQRMTWAAGGFRDVADDTAFGFGNTPSYNVSGRLTGLPVYQDDGKWLVHLGAAYSRQFRSMSTPLRYRSRPEAHLAQRYWDTANAPSTVGLPTLVKTPIKSQGNHLVGLELATVLGPFSLQGEYSLSFVKPQGQRHQRLWGFYGEVSYFLTGEHRAYDRKNGRFDRVAPNANFDPANGHWGAFQIAARYSQLDLNDIVPSAQNLAALATGTGAPTNPLGANALGYGGRGEDITGGINWYLFPNARMMLNYTYSIMHDIRGTGGTLGGATLARSGESSLVQIRAQIDF